MIMSINILLFHLIVLVSWSTVSSFQLTRTTVSSYYSQLINQPIRQSVSSHHTHTHTHAHTPSRLSPIYGKITPNNEGSMDDFRKNVRKELETQKTDPSKLGGRELLEIIIKKWGVAYDLQLRKSQPFGEGSENVYVNVMWRYFGQKSFPMDEREYMEHLEAIGRYITAIDRVSHFLDKVKESRKRPNAYFGYAVGIPLDVDYSTADKFFKDLPYE